MDSDEGLDAMVMCGVHRRRCVFVFGGGVEAKVSQHRQRNVINKAPLCLCKTFTSKHTARASSISPCMLLKLTRRLQWASDSLSTSVFRRIGIMDGTKEARPKGARSGGSSAKPRHVTVSKAMSKLLRHQLDASKITRYPGGYISVKDMVSRTYASRSRTTQTNASSSSTPRSRARKSHSTRSEPSSLKTTSSASP